MFNFESVVMAVQFVSLSLNTLVHLLIHKYWSDPMKTVDNVLSDLLLNFV